MVTTASLHYISGQVGYLTQNAISCEMIYYWPDTFSHNLNNTMFPDRHLRQKNMSNILENEQIPFMYKYNLHLNDHFTCHNFRWLQTDFPTSLELYNKV